MGQSDIWDIIRKSNQKWFEARDIAPKLNTTPEIVRLGMRRLEKSKHLTSETYLDGCFRRVRFRRLKNGK